MTDQEPEVADEFLKTDVLGRVRVRPLFKGTDKM